MKLYGIRNRETGEMVVTDAYVLEDRSECLRFLAETSDPEKYEIISQEVGVRTERHGNDLYMVTERGPIVVEENEE